MISDPSNPKSFSAKARARRFERFVQAVTARGISEASVLDAGGTVDYWNIHLPYLPTGLIKSIDVVNLPPRPSKTEVLQGVELHSYGGNALDKSTLKRDKYDIVYSNSVIEHVGNLRSQKRMADIIQSLADFYWVQTPAKSFPLEPHFYVPFFAYLPLSLRTRLLQRFQLGFVKRRPDWIEARMFCEDTRLITRAELASMFQECDIIKERVLGLCKSLIATNMLKERSTAEPTCTSAS